RSAALDLLGAQGVGDQRQGPQSLLGKAPLRPHPGADLRKQTAWSCLELPRTFAFHSLSPSLSLSLSFSLSLCPVSLLLFLYLSHCACLNHLAFLMCLYILLSPLHTHTQTPP